jgi:hypothetical protein
LLNHRRGAIASLAQAKHLMARAIRQIDHVNLISDDPARTATMLAETPAPGVAPRKAHATPTRKRNRKMNSRLESLWYAMQHPLGPSRELGSYANHQESVEKLIRVMNARGPR